MKKALIIILIVVLVGLGGLVSFSMLVEGSNLVTADEWGRPILEGQHIWAKVIVEEEEIYMPFDDVKEFLYPQIEKDEENRKALIEVNSDLFQFENQELNRFVQGDQMILRFNLKTVDGEAYLPIKSLQDIFGLEINYNETIETVIIDRKDSEGLQGLINKDTHLVQLPKRFSRRVTALKKGEVVKIQDEEEDFYSVRTATGVLGYLRKNNVNTREIVKPAVDHIIFTNQEPWKPEGNIGLVWDYVYQVTKSRRNEDKITALDVVSPTWFDLLSEDGSLENKGDFQYAKDMKDKGYQIWGLVTNSFNPDLTSKFLANEEGQDHFIRQILIYSGLYQLDGINIDFENIYYKDQDALTNFVARLTDKLHHMNLVVSIDVTIPSNSPNWSMVYDRVKLGEIVDYVAVMTYDEHWASSPRSGSVASIGWVERGIQQTLELVPAEKVLLGLPFYTRLWEEEKQPNGKVKVSSRAYGMAKIREILQENDAEIEWNEKTGQYYAEFEKEGKTYKVWLEDARSLGLKTTLVEKYNLAGFAAWRKDFETPEIWDTLEAIIKNGENYWQMQFD